MIYQSTGLVIDLDSVDHAAVVEPTKEDPYFNVMVSFRGSPKSVRLRSVDQEQAFIVLSRIKRGMIAAANGDYQILDDDQPADHYEDDDDDEPKSKPDEPTGPVQS